jgi:hypothetical protein
MQGITVYKLTHNIHHMIKKRITIPLAALALMLTAGGGLAVAAHADTSTTAATTQSTDQGPGGTHTPPAAVGTVTAVDGNTVTLTDKKSGTTYTIDVSSATITKRSAPTASSSTTGTTSTGTSRTWTPPTETTITASDIAVGDTLMVQGTVSGTTITATKVEDGVGGFGGHGGGMGGPDGRGPGVQGTVTAVNGNTITVTGKNGTTYTIDGSSSKVTKMETISVSDIQVGDIIGAQGTVSGDSVTATHIMDGVPPAPTDTATTGTTSS